MRRIDCHMHLWTLAMEQHYALWMTPALTPLYRDYGVTDAHGVMGRNVVEGVVLVSAANSVHETGYLMGLADGHDFVRGVVAWLDLLAPTAVKDIEDWARFAKLKALRPYLQDLPDDDWILRPELAPAIRAIQETGLRFEALIKPRHILHTLRFIDRYPCLPVMVDHMAKPEIGAGHFDAWRRDMEHFRDRHHVHCKISGVVTEDGPNWSVARLQPYVDAVLDIFGPDRLVFGSDWPVVNLVGSYDRWVAALDQALAGLPLADREKVWATNGESYYGL